MKSTWSSLRKVFQGPRSKLARTRAKQWVMRGEDYLSRGVTEEALQCLKKAFELDPSIETEFSEDYPDIKSSKLFKKLLGEN